MKKHIVVIGGYGHVGAQICRSLGEKNIRAVCMLPEETWITPSVLVRKRAAK